MASNVVAAIIASDIADPDMQKFLHEDDVELQNALKISDEVEMTLAYSSEKLANLENLLLNVLAGENDIEAIDFQNDNISAEFIEKAFTFDLLYAILNLELREMDNVTANLQDLILVALNKISLPVNSKECLTKLHDSEGLLKQSQERILEMKIQLAKLQMTSFIFKQNEFKSDLYNTGVKGELRLATTEWKPEAQTAEQRRVLRMLEISLARELDLEKKLTEVIQNEEDLTFKIGLLEKVSVCMEEAAEVAWGRFLEADNTSEVLMGISKEMLGKVQVFHFNLISSNKREQELKSEIQDCTSRLNEKETSIKNLNEEVTGLREKAQKLEETESRFEKVNALTEKSQQQLRAMESEIESLKENLYAAESRAVSAEEKVANLTESNIELTEELDFLKGSNDSCTKKASLFEKQLRDLDIQLQHSRATSEASQEQQNMLYTAIWDMETLIEELKQKVAKAESKTEVAEDRCVVISETNAELNKELVFLRSRVGLMEASLKENDIEKKSRAKEISIKSDLIMDMVMQLATERERIQKQLTSLAKENKLLRERFRKEERNAGLTRRDGIESVVESVEASLIKETEISSESFQVEKSVVNENATESSSSTIGNTNLVIAKDESFVETGKSRKKAYIFVAIFVVLVSILATQLFQREFAASKV
ncbi:PREDICTED: WPP domain-interacting tail-anchored protein 2 [Erythranthe guttata]|uniref:WPP domain-interacting tail-anchored protein 2 n=1 Tax=Erythranthe guttata TaxID=4155 RepID=UPI00064D8174|nr:PREDICTED: WPP domain-interacting tail-anchored protein 2 [Erythranthe guttata]XP_012847727.1 PREDICTED: WPP domain-interacting tail-anchored protein 2 [Erythranthe guttata]|eukprot:XP_012847726.1 PREDICTED: WPP domain-interacting tail-anchored protein 2 [Erythranthe guttata]